MRLSQCLSTLLLNIAIIAYCGNMNAQTSYIFGTNITNGATITTCSGTFYDSGGALGNYGANENYTVTFKSATADPFRVTFFWFDLETTVTCANDRLLIYDGPTTASPLLGTFCGNNSPSSITSSGTTLTFRFISNGTTQNTGWAATLGCADCATADCADFVNLAFQNPTVEANPAGLIGDKWRFPAVMTGIDAIVEITNQVNATAINNIDNVIGPAGAWSPELNFNFNAGQDSYIDWKITMVAAGTNTLTNLPLSSRLTSYDVDGNTNYREIHGHINPNGYILNVPTELTIVTEPPYTMVLGSTLEHPAISNDPEVKVTFYYPGQNNTFFIRLGARSLVNSGNGFRQFALSFDPCVNYTVANVIPRVPAILGNFLTCDFPTIAYNTNELFSSYLWAVNGGTIVSGQGTQNVSVDWSTTGNRSIRLRTTDGNGCIANTIRSVTVNSNPTVTATNTGPYCVGGTLQLNANITSGPAPYTYQWAGPLTYAAATNPATRTNLLLTHAGAYQLTLTDGNTCTNTANTTVSVLADPVISITTTSPAQVCIGASATLNATYTGGAGTCAIQWHQKIGFGAWTNIAGATSTSYVVTSAAATTDYRALVTCTGSGCCE
jgi:CUB domain